MLQNAFNIVIICFLKYNPVLKLFSSQNIRGFFPSFLKNFTDILLSFQVKTADPHLSDENQASKTYEAKAYSSLSQSYLYIDWASNHKILEVGDFININVYPHSRYIHKIHHYSYLVSNRCFHIKY